MRRTRPELTVLCCLILAGAAVAAEPGADDSAQRQRLATERAQAEAQFTLARQACAAEFAVTACLDTAQAQRRQVLQRIASEQARLDDAQRIARRDERLATVAQRRAALQASAPAAHAESAASVSASASVTPKASAEPKTPGASAPVASPDKARPARSPHVAAVAAAKAASAASTAKARAERFERQQRRAQAHEAEVRRRNAARDARRPPSAGLPPPETGR